MKTLKVFFYEPKKLGLYSDGMRLTVCVLTVMLGEQVATLVRVHI